MTAEIWVRDYEQGIEYLESRNGVDWFRAPKPPRRHNCTAQTRGYMSRSYVERCACGAISFDGDYWMEKNGERGASSSRRGYGPEVAAGLITALPLLAAFLLIWWLS